MRRGKSDKPPLTNRGVISSVRTERQGVVERISTSVDWLTATTQKASGGEGWKAHFLLSQEEPIQDTKFFGFDCRRDAAGQTFGQRARDGRFIYILSGMAANRFWRQIAPRASSVTRFDVAVDCYLREPREQVKHSARVVLSSAYETNRKYARFHGRSGGYGRASTGDTLYVGSRQSTAYGRLYDKGLQTKTCEPGRWIRYEIEYKGGGAFQAQTEALKTPPDLLGEWIESTVYKWFKGRDVVPLFVPNSDALPFHVRSFLRVSSNEKKLMWLSSQVKPTVEYLWSQGFGFDVLDALGLTGEMYDGWAKLAQASEMSKMSLQPQSKPGPGTTKQVNGGSKNDSF